MKFTSKRAAGVAVVGVIAAVAMIGGAAGMGGSNSPSTGTKPSKKPSQPTRPSKDPAAVEVHKLMEKAAKKNDSQPVKTADSGKKANIANYPHTKAIPGLSITIRSPIRTDHSSDTEIEVFGMASDPHEKISVSVQKTGQPVSWPKICPRTGTTSKCNFPRFQGKGYYRAYVSKMNGGTWSFPLVTDWILI